MSIVPRYKLDVGSQLRYRMSDENAGQEPSKRISIEWNFNVIARNGNGSWKVLFSESRAEENDSPSGTRTVRTVDQDGFFDIAPDGRLIENRTITPLANPYAIFPQLPAEESELAAGWNSNLQLDGTCCQYVSSNAPAAANQSVWQFAQDCQTQLDRVYLASRRRFYTFDLDRGVVTCVTTVCERDWPDYWASTDSIHLIEIIEPAGSNPVPIAQEVDRYFEVCAEYQRLIDLALWDVPQSYHWLNRAGDALAQFETTVRTELIGQLVRRKLKLHQDEHDNLLSDAQQLALILDKPGPDWRSTDRNGSVHAMEDYRGKILALIFWNRGCSWCIRTLLALNSLASEVRDQPIVFLGVSADSNVHDRAFVSQTLHLNFPTISNLEGETNIAGSYGIDSFPTTMLIDQVGVVRRVRAGYSAQLSSLIARDLRRLSEGVAVTATTS